MPNIIITPDMLEGDDAKIIAALTEQYGDDFARLRSGDRRRLISDIGKIFIAVGGGGILPKERRGYGDERAYALAQAGRDQDLERLDILVRHKKQLLALQSQETRTASEDQRTYASLVRSLAMMGIQDQKTRGDLAGTDMEVRMNLLDRRDKRTQKEQNEITAAEKSGVKRAKAPIAKFRDSLTTDGKLTAKTYIEINNALVGFGNDAEGRTAYIQQLNQDGFDAFALMTTKDAKTSVSDGKTAGTVSSEATAEALTRYADHTNDRAAANKRLKKEANANIAAWSAISRYAGVDADTMAVIQGAIDNYNSVGAPDGTGSEIRDYDAADAVQKLYNKYEEEQDEAEAKRGITEWAQLDQMLADSKEFQDHKKLHAPGASDREYFREMEVANLEKKDREQEVIDKERGVSDTMDRAEKIASGEALNANALERLVAKTRVGVRNLGRGIVDLFDGDDDDDGDGSSVSPTIEPELDDLPEAGATNDTDLLADENEDERVTPKKPSAEGTSGANADAESPQATGGESQKDKDAKKKQAKKVTRQRSVTGFGYDDAPKISDYYGN